MHRVIREFSEGFSAQGSDNPAVEIQKLLSNLIHKQWDKAAETFKSINLLQDQIEFYFDDSKQMLLNYGRWFLQNGMRLPEASEQKMISWELGIMGIVDAIYEIEGSTKIIDYKTSKRSTITEDILRQAALYAVLYLEKNRKTPGAVWIHFLKEPSIVKEIGVNEYLIDYGRKLIEMIHRKTESEREGDYQCTCGGYCERDFIQ